MILVRFYYLEGVCHLSHQVLEHSPDVTRKISKRVRSMLKSELLLQTSNFLEIKMVYSSYAFPIVPRQLIMWKVKVPTSRSIHSALFESE
jgi:hypothetical protein